jgi:hypothetical protein
MLPSSPTRLDVPRSSAPRPLSTASSLATNYVPTKFSTPPIGGVRKRNRIPGMGAGGSGADGNARKQGGGREAFGNNEARMPGSDDVDYDGVDDVNIFRNSGRRTLRWNKFKWTLFLTNIVVSVYGLITLIFCILTWLNTFRHADILRVGNRPELILSTIAAVLTVFTSLVGWAGILLNNRSFLAVYTFLLWVVFAFSVAPGYMTYKKRTFNLEGKVNAQWSRDLGSSGRLRIQNQVRFSFPHVPF